MRLEFFIFCRIKNKIKNPQIKHSVNLVPHFIKTTFLSHAKVLKVSEVEQNSKRLIFFFLDYYYYNYYYY